MSWNYRVIEFVDPTDNEPWRAIHEVHYDDEGRPAAYAENAARVISTDDAGTNVGLDWVLAKMREALDRPVLFEKDFVGNRADV